MWSSGAVLAAVAVGNTGEMDRASGNARVQVPSDCVNSLGIGAADSSTADWRRAAYSSVGPGRSPGLIKPDVLSFGGGEKNPSTSMEQTLRHFDTLRAQALPLQQQFDLPQEFAPTSAIT